MICCLNFTSPQKLMTSMFLFTPTPFQAFRPPLVLMGSLQYQMSRQKKCGLRTSIQDLMALVKPAFVEYKDRTRTLIVIAITARIRKRMREDSAHSPNAKIYQILRSRIKQNTFTCLTNMSTKP